MPQPYFVIVYIMGRCDFKASCTKVHRNVIVLDNGDLFVY
ncbi:hypothetical protein SDC9_106152 [bioreactor metagenome]|uniref:Uncharacterized protein n=1 Tax=bioreactor metagenome TaxID=1076179 RepID=A0A645B1I4_9ZZZZ